MENYNPEYVLILSGDHIYKMDYEVMLEYHKANNADVTIAAMQVPIEEASRLVSSLQMTITGLLSLRRNRIIREATWRPWVSIFSAGRY